MLRKLLPGLLLAASSLSCFAAMQASNGKDVVTLRESACTNPEVLIRIPVDRQKEFLTGEVLLQGKAYKVCWTVQNSGVLLVYPDGDQGLLPPDLFHEVGV